MKVAFKGPWLDRIVGRWKAWRTAERPFVLDGWVPFASVVEFDHRWPGRKRGGRVGR